MKDRVQEQQRLGEIMPRFAPDNPEQLDQSAGWEQFAGIEVYPRRSPWKTAGVDDDSILAQVSDKQLVVNTSNVTQVQNIITGGSTAGAKRSIRLLTRVYVSGNNLVAEYTTYQIDFTGGTKSTEIIAQGSSCN